MPSRDVRVFQRGVKLPNKLLNASSSLVNSSMPLLHHPRNPSSPLRLHWNILLTYPSRKALGRFEQPLARLAFRIRATRPRRRTPFALVPRSRNLDNQLPRPSNNPLTSLLLLPRSSLPPSTLDTPIRIPTLSDASDAPLPSTLPSTKSDNSSDTQFFPSTTTTSFSSETSPFTQPSTSSSSKDSSEYPTIINSAST